MDDSNIDEFQNKKVHPQLKSSFLCNLFFCWGVPIFYKGLNRELGEDDLYKPFKKHESHRLGDQLEEIWKLEKMNYSEPVLWRALWKMFRRDIIGHIFVMLFLEFVLKLSQPLLLGKLMNYYSPHKSTVTLQEAYIYAGSIILTSFLYVLISHSYFLSLQHLGMKMRIACCSLIYRKTLKLSKKALVKTTIGQMINLLSNDVNRLDNCFKSFHYLWAAPVETVIVMYLLFQVVGVTGLAGFGILIFFIPLQVTMGKLTTIFRLKTAVRTDERVRLMSEIISGIQVIKMYTWEKSFARLLENMRRLEIKEIKFTNNLRAFHTSFNKCITRISVFLCIITYTFIGNRPNAEYVYVVSGFYSILKSAMTTDFPQGVTQMAETLVSLDRIEKFLLFDEVHLGALITPISIKKIYTSTPLIHSSSKKSIGIYLQDISAKWISDQEYALNRINFNVGPKQLVAIVGAVGSGKSSLLHAIMKELPLLRGCKDIVGRISYASQEPWLFAGTIKQNILFGEEWDSKRYERIIKVCALERDLILLPYGDRSIVGDRGVTLSGGQRARINLARAIYKEADIYILDDPLSAVDTYVGKQLFDECITGYLKNKCTVLVTHQLQYLRNVSKIYLMENGCINTIGTYEEIRNSNSEFAKLFKPHIQEEECDDTIDEEGSESKYFDEMIDEPSEIKALRRSGSISSKVYKSYLKSGGGWFCSIVVFMLFVLTQLVSSEADYFVKFWVNLEQTKSEMKMANNTPLAGVTISTTNRCILIYTFVIVLLVIVTISRTISFYKICMQASIRLHNTMFASICNATMLFFNTNSAGRILNRFSKDMGCIDEIFPHLLIDTVQIALNVLAVNILIATVSPWILVPTGIIGILFYLLQNCLRFYQSTYKTNGSNNPVFSHISASLQGLTTIRAFGAQEILRNEFDKHQDLHSSAFYMVLGCNHAFGLWLDMLCVIYIALVTLSFFLIGNETFGGNVGLAITQAMSLTGMLQWGMRQWSELDNSMTSVERVVEYTEIRQESDADKKEPPKTWPEHGVLEFQSVYLRYATNEPYVLNNLTFKIKRKEKVGIVGRTGAGKSSLISALFRLADIEGKILIDGISTGDIPLKSMRSKIAIIPQEPVLFSGSLRSNLDPMNEYQDSDLWDSLEQVELKGVISDKHFSLESKILEGGANLSVGQRQLVCLARAILRNNKILVLDEATANVDPKTDALIQSTIRNKFADCTVLTVAHRLHTVMDSDKVLVMDAGSAVEFNHPHILLQNIEGIFYGLVRETGKSTAEHLAEVAKQGYKDLHSVGKL